jgi:diacylglycerol kinase family enzyme
VLARSSQLAKSGRGTSAAGRERRRYVAIVSGAIRYGVDRVASLLGTALRDENDLQLEVVASSEEATAAARAAASWADTVIAVGGDGTVADVATGILASEATLAIVPAGSTNMTARTLGIPGSPRRAVSLLAKPHDVRAIDVGRFVERCFLHIAGAGYDAELFLAADPDWKRRLGWFAYLPAAASAIQLPPSEITVTVDAETITAVSPLVLVANGGSIIAPTIKLHPAIVADDGVLDVLVLTSSGLGAVAAALGGVGWHGLEAAPGVLWRRGTRVRVVASPPLAVQLDGDVRGVTPAQFRLEPLAMRVIVPRGQPPR